MTLQELIDDLAHKIRDEAVAWAERRGLSHEIVGAAIALTKEEHTLESAEALAAEGMVPEMPGATKVLMLFKRTILGLFGTMIWVDEELDHALAFQIIVPDTPGPETITWLQEPVALKGAIMEDSDEGH